MSRRTRRLLSATVAAGLALSVGSAALAAPVGALKQFKVPTARSAPRYITSGSDGNRWFTEGSEFTNPPRIGRITPAGAITEFEANCSGCLLGDIIEGPGRILYVTSNDATLMRFDLASGTFLDPIDIPRSSALDGNLAVSGDDIWFDEFNVDSLWRYDTAGADTGFTAFPTVEPDDVEVDSDGFPWFTSADDQSVNRLDPATGDVQRFPVTSGLNPGSITIATDEQIWFTSIIPGGVGRLDPDTGTVTTLSTPGTDPETIAASPDGSVWFAQERKGNIARIDNNGIETGVITESKVVKGSGPFGITVAPNADPWYTMPPANKIAAFVLR